MPTSTTEALDIRQERTDRGHGNPSGLSRWQRLVISVLKGGPVPRHIAFIMDGNRRYAREHGMEVAEGHRMGYSKLEEALRWCAELGVSAVTVYAFSIENFKRTSREVDDIMALSKAKLHGMAAEDSIIQQQGIRVRIVGDLSRVSSELRAEMQHVMQMTQTNQRATLNVCFSYTSMVRVLPWQRTSSAPAPPQGAPDGSGQLGAPRKRPAHWAPSHCLGCSS